MIYTQSINDLDVKLINDILKIDELVYPEHLQGSFDEVYGRFKANREMFVLLYDACDIIGYICFFPIKETLYESILSEDRIFDSDIPGDMIEAYEPNKTHRMYFISAVIHPDYQGRGLSKLLVDRLQQFLIEKSEQKIKFSTALATSITPGGEVLCRKLGFKKIKRLQSGYTVHELNINDLLRRINP